MKEVRSGAVTTLGAGPLLKERLGASAAAAGRFGPKRALTVRAGLATPH